MANVFVTESKHVTVYHATRNCRAAGKFSSGYQTVAVPLRTAQERGLKPCRNCHRS